MIKNKKVLNQLARMIDHTLLKNDVCEKDFITLCEEANNYHFKMVAINPAATELCKSQLQGTDVHVGAAIGFPLGQTTLECKVFETKDAIAKGADEIDYVINIVAVKNRNWAYIRKEMEEIVEICREQNVISKVIFENCCLKKEEIRQLSLIAKEVQPDFIKTSTGFGRYGAQVEDVKLMKSAVGDSVKIKAAGGIRDLDSALSMIEAGAERIGTSSGIQIIESLKVRLEEGETFDSIGGKTCSKPIE